MIRKAVVVSSLLATGLLALLPSIAWAGAVTLHPSGFGQHSYAAWKAGEGLPDSTGNANQALYFQKMVPTATNAAGVAIFHGVAGVPVNELSGLQWKHRDDGHCGAGAPRWDVISEDSSGNRYVIFLGCAAAAHSPGGTSTDKEGVTHLWITDTQPSPAGQSCQLETFPFTVEPPGFCDTFPITSLAIVFDEGTDQGQGFVFLDDITITVNGVTYTWTSAADNGNGDPGTATVDPLTGLPAPSVLPNDLLTALVVDFNEHFPTVPPSSISFYEGVIP